MTEAQIIEELKRRRKEAKLTQADLAEKLGMKQQYIGAIEQGQKGPTVKTLVKICEALELEVKVEKRS